MPEHIFEWDGAWGKWQALDGVESLKMLYTHAFGMQGNALLEDQTISYLR